jgi:nicotinamide mononucleotide (NMN) deamidase PncC
MLFCWQVVKAIAASGLEKFQSTYAISTSGVADPEKNHCQEAKAAPAPSADYH